MTKSKQARRIPVKGATSAEEKNSTPEETVATVQPEPEFPESVPQPEPQAAESTPETPTATPEAPAVDWRDMALRQQAEMDNYRKRMERRAEDRILDEKSRLLRGFLSVMDNLEQALAHIQRDDPVLQGVRVTYDAMQALLRAEGVEALSVVGKPFDPAWQEAVAMLPAQPDQEAELLVLAEEQKGYRLGERLLRPARVVVTKK